MGYFSNGMSRNFFKPNQSLSVYTEITRLQHPGGAGGTSTITTTKPEEPLPIGNGSSAIRPLITFFIPLYVSVKLYDNLTGYGC